MLYLLNCDIIAPCDFCKFKCVFFLTTVVSGRACAHLDELHMILATS